MGGAESMMSRDEGQGEGGKKRGDERNDSSIPVGNTGPLPGWPLWVAAALWGGWMVFLAVTALGGL